MSSKERRTVPAEAVEIYNQYIHGEISRRSFLDGVKKFAVVGLTSSAIVEALMPDYAMGQQSRLTIIVLLPVMRLYHHQMAMVS